jgi:dienelactone hydrolase
MPRFVLLILLSTSLAAQDVPRPMAADIHEQRLFLPVTVNDHGKTLTVTIPVTFYCPDGAGPFPLVILSHGRAGTPVERKVPGVQRLELASRYFVRKGFAVAVPTRIGYGQVADQGDPEAEGNSGDLANYRDAVEAGASEVLQVAAQVQKLPFVDPTRLVLVGQSVGGYVTTAAAAHNPPGLIAAINFAGGQGGNPVKHPAVPMAPATLEKLFAEFGKTSRAPMLWIYTENDLYFGPTYTRRWHDAFVGAGGQADYRLLPPFGANGHLLFAQGNDIWQPIVDGYLAPLGFPIAGAVPRP